MGQMAGLSTTYAVEEGETREVSELSERGAVCGAARGASLAMPLRPRYAPPEATREVSERSERGAACGGVGARILSSTFAFSIALVL